MKERYKFYANEEKSRILQEAGYACVHCGGRAVNLAHKIAKTKANLSKFGAEVIHHKFNLAAVCEKPRCNDAQNIGNKPFEVSQLVDRITKDNLKWWEKG